MASRPWRPPSEQVPRKRPYSPPESPTRNTRMRNAIHKDVLFEQGIYSTYASFSARGSRAISCFRDGFVRVWNVDPVHNRFLDCEHVLQHGETVYRAAVSDCGTRAVTTAGDGVARIWELTRPDRPSTEIGSQYRSTRSCDVSSDGKFVAATFYTGKKLPISKFQGTVVLFDPARDAEVFRNPIAGVPDKVRVSRNGRIVAVGCYGVTPAKIMARDTRLTLFKPDGEVKYFFPRCFQDEDACVAWDLSDDGRYVAICGQNRSVIELYTEMAPKQWASHPVILRAAAPLIYEKVRVVDDGELVTALALDRITKERSVLVFQPSSGNVLFSLACGIKDPKGCVDLEPRVCYVVGSYERAERKVVRLLSRTSGDGASLKLVRCGDPPKQAVQDHPTQETSAAQSTPRNILSPPLRSGEAGTTASPRAPRLLQDSPTPVRPRPTNTSPLRPQLMNSPPANPQRNNVSPTRSQPLGVSSTGSNQTNIPPTHRNGESIRPSILPNDDQFALVNRNDGGTTMVVDELNKVSTTRQASPTLSTSNLSHEVLPMQQTGELSEQALPAKEANNINNGPLQGVQVANFSTSIETRPLETSDGVNQAAENKPTATDAKSKSSELIRAKMEKLMCKSTIAAKSAQPNSSALADSNGTGKAREFSGKERDEGSLSNEARDSEPQLGNLSSDQVTDKPQRSQTNDATNFSKPTSNAFKIVDENIDSLRQSPPNNRQSSDSNAEMKEVPIALTSILKKPRWQRMKNKELLGNKGEITGVDGVLSVEGAGAEDQGDAHSKTKTAKNADDDTSRVNGRLSDVSPVAAWQGSATSPGTQGIINSYRLHGNKVTEPEQRPANNIGSNPSLNEKNCPTMAPAPTAENEAKDEDVLTYSNVGGVPQQLPTASGTVTKEAKTTYEVKEEDNHAYKNRYFLALETAKALFFQASREAGGEQVVSNVKCFKAMMELFRHNELIDRKTVARIVYEKGGIRDALDETLFLEAFSVLYGKVQAVRQRLWSEVYDQAGAEEEGLLVFHARDLVTRECKSLNVELNPVWNNDTLEEVIASYSADGVLVDRNAFVQAADHIFSI